MGAVLVLGALGHEPAKLLHPARQLIARPLEFFQAQQARADDRLAPWTRCGDVGEALGHDRRQLPLEPCHLGPQRVPGGPLADLDTR
jgi:hypothetical protein